VIGFYSEDRRTPVKSYILVFFLIVVCFQFFFFFFFFFLREMFGRNFVWEV